MNKKLIVMVMGSSFLAGCATSSNDFHFEPGNSPSQCAKQIVQGKVPVSEQHDYVQRCSAGYRQAQHDDADDSIQFKPLHKSGKGQ